MRSWYDNKTMVEAHDDLLTEEHFYNFDLVKNIVKAFKGDENYKGFLGWILHDCYMYGANFETTKYMIDHGASLKSDYGKYSERSIADQALLFNDVEMVKYLVGRDDVSFDIYSCLFTDEGCVKECSFGFEAIDFLLKNGNIVNINDEFSDDNINNLICSGIVESVEGLVKRGLDLGNFVTKDTLKMAIESNSGDMLHYLLNYGYISLTKEDRIIVKNIVEESYTGPYAHGWDGSIDASLLKVLKERKINFEKETLNKLFAKAMKQRNFETVNYLLENGVTLTKSGLNKVLLNGVTYTNLNTIKYAIYNGADINCCTKTIYKKSKDLGGYRQESFYDCFNFLKKVADDKWKCSSCIVGCMCKNLCKTFDKPDIEGF